MALRDTDHTHAAAGGQEPGQIGREELLRRLDDPQFVLLNVLPRAAFDEAHIPGTLSLPLDDIPERAAALLPDRRAAIAVHCAGPT
jgi:rhodanese-related sulfurtransferase